MPGDGNGIPFSFEFLVRPEGFLSTCTFLAKRVRSVKPSIELSDNFARTKKVRKPASSQERVLLRCFQ